ncbi:MAG: tetratricopeptide repeat protein, partial [Opitutales bacterium]
REATEVAPRDPVAVYNLAGALALSDRPAEALAALERDVELGDTDWRCWLIIDEDKNPWRYVKVDHIVYRGHPVNVITARYDDRTVASLTGVRQRRLYLNRERDIGHAVEYLDHRGDPLTVLELLEHQAFELEGKTQFRTRRLLLHNFEEQTMTAQVRRDTVFNTQLPEELFEPEQIDEWDGRWDAEVMRLLGDTHATEVPDEVKLTLQASGRITSVVVRRASDRQSLWTGSLREGEEASITIGEKVVILATSIENLSVRLRGETFRSEGSGIGKLTFEPGGPSR